MRETAFHRHYLPYLRRVILENREYEGEQILLGDGMVLWDSDVFQLLTLGLVFSLVHPSTHLSGLNGFGAGLDGGSNCGKKMRRERRCICDISYAWSGFLHNGKFVCGAFCVMIMWYHSRSIISAFRNLSPTITAFVKKYRRHLAEMIYNILPHFALCTLYKI